MITVNPSRNVLIIGPELSFSIDRPDASKAKKKKRKKGEKKPWKAAFVSGCSAKMSRRTQPPADCAAARGGSIIEKIKGKFSPP